MPKGYLRWLGSEAGPPTPLDPVSCHTSISSSSEQTDSVLHRFNGLPMSYDQNTSIIIETSCLYSFM